MRALQRIIRAGLLAALAVGLGGWALERLRFGGSVEDAVARVEAEIQERIAASAGTLQTIAEAATTRRGLIEEARRDSHDSSVARELFDALDSAVRPEQSQTTGVAVYDTAGVPLAWAGQVWDAPRELNGPGALLIRAGPRGPRLVRIQPLTDPAGARLATVVVEQTLE